MRKTRKYLRKEMSKRGLKFIIFVQCLLFLSPTNLFKNFLFFFFFFKLILHPLLLREEGHLICYMTVGPKQVHKQKENRFADLVDKKKALVQDTSKR